MATPPTPSGQAESAGQEGRARRTGAGGRGRSGRSAGRNLSSRGGPVSRREYLFAVPVLPGPGTVLAAAGGTGTWRQPRSRQGRLRRDDTVGTTAGRRRRPRAETAPSSR